jgi:hypothetical protein
LSLYEKLALSSNLTEFEDKILSRLDHKIIDKIRINHRYKSITDISKLISIDQNELSYGEFFPGKILGSTLLV